VGWPVRTRRPPSWITGPMWAQGGSIISIALIKAKT
jgi:hypothetical protein